MPDRTNINEGYVLTKAGKSNLKTFLYPIINNGNRKTSVHNFVYSSLEIGIMELEITFQLEGSEEIIIYSVCAPLKPT